MCTTEKEAQRGVKEQHEPGLTFLSTLSDILTDHVVRYCRRLHTSSVSNQNPETVEMKNIQLLEQS